MNRTFLIGALFLVAASGAWLYLRKGRQANKDRLIIGNMEIVPESVSAERAARLLPTSGSEDASHILLPIHVDPFPSPHPAKSYPPNPDVDWVVEVTLRPGLLVSGRQVQSVFDSSWLKAHGGAVIHGFAPSTNTWTYVGAGDAPEPYSKIAIAKSLVHADGLAPEAFDSMLSSIEDVSRRWQGVSVSASESSDIAAARARKLAGLKHKYELDAAIVLVAPAASAYEGRAVWDVMHSLGLQWGDMDLFHWRNSTDVGDDFWFSVSTSTPPGYFLPEAIAAGKVQVSDLVFSYSVPRSSSPVEALGRMHAAATYAQKRLGGELQDGNAHPFNLEATRTELARVAQELTAAGFPPGAPSTLQLF